MGKTCSTKTARKRAASPLMVRLDEKSKRVLAKAAGLRRTSISDYVRIVTVTQAHREVESASSGTIALSPDEQLKFWQALQSPPKLTPSQRRLGALMRGKE
jgi:uncharacterized protein (DUF1778 family)